MKIPSIFRSILGRPSIDAAVQLPPMPEPKVRGGQQVLPSFLKTSKPNTASALTREERQLINTDITTYRGGASARETIRNFVKGSPDLSAAVTSYVRTAITSGYTAVAKNMDGTVSPDGTQALAEVLVRLNIVNDYSIGYDDSQSIRSLCETWAREILIYGGAATELVLNKARLPDKLQAINIGQINLYASPDGKRLLPKQKVGDVEIDLNVPTFFMVTLDQDTLVPYAESPIEPALQAVLFSAQFMNDIRRIVQKAIHPRVVVTINEDKFKKSIPPDVVAGGAEAVTGYMNSIISGLKTQIDDLKPEDCLVLFDSIGVDVLDHGNTNLSNEYAIIQEMADAKMSTGAKVLPTVLGHSGGTSNTASAEVLMFVKYVEGTVWAKINELLSKALTLAVRLLGHDVYVEFTLNPIDLKPESELEAFRSMKQSRVLDLLSLGFVSDEEASISLTGHLPPAGFQPLSGTGFRKTATTTPAGDGYNGASNSGSTMNQNLAPTTPTSPKSQNGGKKADAQPLTLGA